MLSGLTLLSNCKILPATEGPSNIGFNDPCLAKGEYLVPLKLAETVLDSDEMYKGIPLFSALRDLGLPALNNSLLCASSAPNSFLIHSWVPINSHGISWRPLRNQNLSLLH